MAFDFNITTEDNNKENIIDNIIVDSIVSYLSTKYKGSNTIEFDKNSLDKVLSVNIHDDEYHLAGKEYSDYITFILDFESSDIVITSTNNLKYSFIHNTVNTVLKAPGIFFNNFIIQSSGKNFDYFLRSGS